MSTINKYAHIGSLDHDEKLFTKRKIVDKVIATKVPKNMQKNTGLYCIATSNHDCTKC